MVFEETKIGTIPVKNRIIRSATHDGMVGPDGAPTDALIRKYVGLAKNEVGCIITGYAGVAEEGFSNYPGMLKIHDDSLIPAYEKLVSAVHEAGAPIVLQIAHCGRQTSSKKIGQQKVAPSNVIHTFYPDRAEVMSDLLIYAMIDDFVEAAIRAEKAGFDAVELHGGHGYILHDFMSAYGNRRKDSFGGSVKNRAKVVELIIKRIKEKTNIPVWIKISAEDNRRNGMRIDTTIEILKILEAAGLDAVEVSCGTVEDGMNTMRSKLMPMAPVFKYREPVASFPEPLKKVFLPAANLINPLIKQPTPLENFNVPNAAKIKAALNIPVIAVGGIHKLSDMEDIISTGKADFVSMCRPFICEPNLVKKLHEGTQTEAKCLMCNYCGLVIEKDPTKCLYGRV